MLIKNSLGTSVHLLWILPGSLSRRRHRRDLEHRVRHRDPRRALVQQGKAIGQRRPSRGRDRCQLAGRAREWGFASGWTVWDKALTWGRFALRSSTVKPVVVVRQENRPYLLYQANLPTQHLPYFHLVGKDRIPACPDVRVSLVSVVFFSF